MAAPSSAVRGYVTACDAKTGEQAWRSSPPNPEKKPDNAASDKIFAEKGNALGRQGRGTETGGSSRRGTP